MSIGSACMAELSFATGTWCEAASHHTEHVTNPRLSVHLPSPHAVPIRSKLVDIPGGDDETPARSSMERNGSLPQPQRGTAWGRGADDRLGTSFNEREPRDREPRGGREAWEVGPC